MPTASPEDLYAALTDLAIAFAVHEHPPVFTVEEARLHCSAIPGVHCKNLFLKDAGDRLWLVVVPDHRQVDLKTLHTKIGAKRLSFGRAGLLRDVLGVEPGSVTPFALINDRAKRVNVVLDAWMLRQERVNYHPLVNTATVGLRPQDLLAFIAWCGHAPQTIELG